jgi:hypothetical protein
MRIKSTRDKGGLISASGIDTGSDVRVLFGIGSQPWRMIIDTIRECIPLIMQAGD